MKRADSLDQCFKVKGQLKLMCVASSDVCFQHVCVQFQKELWDL